ncbi:PQQ-dependent sugar dehydrogenase [Yinghuangia seranimata]|uniref:PQQ-dependent sugar dehydrogenase n=1 Tax=Yinghuangia seranimata TaxID=408067 RepID=UPI00248B27EF|nr:PQQ-dependent sugar dehydrogenase [Yinghuangia seranimata]MDI2130250.1 PQQ-dependent sugar dehydrogenase [Yinghuangia seranimata]
MGIVLALTASVFTFLNLTRRSEAAEALPPGFSFREQPTGQQQWTLTDFAYTPDGGYFTAGKTGHIAWISPDGRVVPVADVPTEAVDDLGLIGLAVAPDYATSRTIYTARASDAKTLRLSSFHVEGTGEPTGVGAEHIMLEAPRRADIAVHAITGVVAAPDGTVWVSVGDNADYRAMDPRALDAQNPDVIFGKLLHVTSTGAGVPTNPGYNAADPTSWRSRTYASGFRSPFRLSLDPVTGAPMVGDVGWSSWEEVDLVQPGNNYGWPCWEGDAPTADYRDLPGCKGVSASGPLYTYSHNGANGCVTGGIVYTGTSYPEQYRGTYFFGDYSLRKLWTLPLRDGAGQPLAHPVATDFGTETGAVVKLAAAPNGDIVSADLVANKIRRLVYEAGNRAPTASATSTVDAAAMKVDFDASGSSDLDGDQLTYAWDFGDGSTGTGVKVSHTYSAPDAVVATLTVTDPGGKTGEYRIKVIPNHAAPKLSWTGPTDEARFKVNDPIHFDATATDASGGALPITWTKQMVHCYGGGCHVHPDGTSQVANTYETPFVDHGDDTHIQLTATTTDAEGVTTQRVYNAWPKLVTLTVASDIPAAVTINTHQAQTVEVASGAAVTVTAPQKSNDGVATFVGWPTSGDRTRTLTMPDHDLTLTLGYDTPIDQAVKPGGPLAGLGAPTGAEVGDAALRYRDFANGRAYWSPATGVHSVRGAALTAYLAQGGATAFGPPSTEEQVASDGVARFTVFGAAGTAAVYTTPTTGSHLMWGGIYAKWKALGAEKGTVGYPVTDEGNTGRPGGRYNNFEHGSITWSATTGAHAVSGVFAQKFAEFGWDAGPLGFPTTDEADTGRPGGRYINFQGGTIIWNAATGVHGVYGGIGQKWGEAGWDAGYLGFPATDEANTGHPGGRYQVFQGGTAYWSPDTGAQIVHGAIADKYAQYGWDAGILAFPTTSELPTTQKPGAYNHFQNGSIFWSPATGAHMIRGGIRDKWASMGWENSSLGFPTSEEYDIAGGRRQDFQGGYITWTPKGGAVSHR